MIEDVADHVFGTNLPAAVPDAFLRHPVSLGPVHQIDVVNRLLDDVISREPGEMHPTAQLAFQRAEIRVHDGRTGFAGVVGSVNRADVTDLAAENFFIGRALRQMRAPAEPRGDREVLLFRFSNRFHDGAVTKGVGADWFLGKNMFIAFDGIFDVERTKAGRRRQQHHVDSAINNLPVGIEPDEALVVIHLHLAADLGIFFQIVAARSQIVGKRVAHCDQTDVGFRQQGVLRRSGTAATASHQSDFQNGIIRGKSPAGKKKRRGHCAAEGSRSGCLDEFATRSPLV